MKSPSTTMCQVTQTFCRSCNIGIATRDSTVRIIIINIEEDCVKFQVATRATLFYKGLTDINVLVWYSACEEVDTFSSCKQEKQRYMLLLTSIVQNFKAGQTSMFWTGTLTDLNVLVWYYLWTDIHLQQQNPTIQNNTLEALKCICILESPSVLPQLDIIQLLTFVEVDRKCYWTVKLHTDRHKAEVNIIWFHGDKGTPYSFLTGSVAFILDSSAPHPTHWKQENETKGAPETCIKSWSAQENFNKGIFHRTSK